METQFPPLGASFFFMIAMNALLKGWKHAGAGAGDVAVVVIAMNALLKGWKHQEKVVQRSHAGQIAMNALLKGWKHEDQSEAEAESDRLQ